MFIRDIIIVRNIIIPRGISPVSTPTWLSEIYDAISASELVLHSRELPVVWLCLTTRTSSAYKLLGLTSQTKGNNFSPFESQNTFKSQNSFESLKYNRIVILLFISDCHYSWMIIRVTVMFWVYNTVCNQSFKKLNIDCTSIMIYLEIVENQVRFLNVQKSFHKKYGLWPGLPSEVFSR